MRTFIKKQRRRIGYGVLITGLCVVALLSGTQCNQSYDLPSRSEQSLNNAPLPDFAQFKHLGAQHNAALEVIYQEFLQARNAGKSLKETLQDDFIWRTTRNYIAQQEEYQKYIPVLDKQAEAIKADVIKLLNTTPTEYINNSDLNAVQKAFALRLISIDEETPKAFEAALLPIVKEIENEVSLSDKEKYPLLAMSGVGLSSFNYWFYNRDKWEQLFNPNAGKWAVYPMGGFWNNLFAADAIGGIVGGAVSLITTGGATLGPAVVGGAVGSSLGFALWELIKKTEYIQPQKYLQPEKFSKELFELESPKKDYLK